MPMADKYGGWPTSGEIDLMESRGNLKLFNPAGVNVGAEQVGHTMHFGPRWDVNGWPTAHYTKNNAQSYHNGFHKYGLKWTNTSIEFFIDGVSTGIVEAGTGEKKKIGNFRGISKRNSVEICENEKLVSEFLELFIKWKINEKSMQIPKI
jgi:hypothetical protein